MTTVEERAAAVVAAEVERRCFHCWRVKATAEDWETYADDEGTHLCWEPDESRSLGVCGRTPQSIGEHLTAALAAANLLAQPTADEAEEDSRGEVLRRRIEEHRDTYQRALDEGPSRSADERRLCELVVDDLDHALREYAALATPPAPERNGEASS